MNKAPTFHLISSDLPLAEHAFIDTPVSLSDLLMVRARILALIHTIKSKLSLVGERGFLGLRDQVLALEALLPLSETQQLPEPKPSALVHMETQIEPIETESGEQRWRIKNIPLPQAENMSADSLMMSSSEIILRLNDSSNRLPTHLGMNNDQLSAQERRRYYQELRAFADGLKSILDQIDVSLEPKPYYAASFGSTNPFENFGIAFNGRQPSPSTPEIAELAPLSELEIYKSKPLEVSRIPFFIEKIRNLFLGLMHLIRRRFRG